MNTPANTRSETGPGVGHGEPITTEPQVLIRNVPPQAMQRLQAAGIHPVLARVYASRGIASADELAQSASALLPPEGLLGIDRAALRLAQAIAGRQKILIVADYDCDGATACAVGIRGLRAMGAQVDYLVPNRKTHGYGLSPAIVDLATTHPRLGKPDLIVTVDNGIASIEGVQRATDLGIEVIITDHHLPGDRLPAACAIVNPNQPGCGFGSRNLAGVGVMFYLLLALRALLRREGAFSQRREPALQVLLDLVAVGTIADLVRLDANNRLLVMLGLHRIRSGQAQPGVRALLAVAGRQAQRVGCEDIGFAVGPRINAAGRLADITIGIECLLAEDDDEAQRLAAELDRINQERRSIEETMRQQAFDAADLADLNRQALLVFREDWHPGVIGLVASRLKDRHHRPTIALAPAGEAGQLVGSGRSIPGVHLRDVIDLAAKLAPQSVLRFGGHAMAAGLTLAADRLDAFEAALQTAVGRLADPDAFSAQLWTDGGLADQSPDLDLVAQIDQAVWGQGFPAPLFLDEARVLSQRLLKERHLRLELQIGAQRHAAIAFGRAEPLPARARIAYRLSRNDWGGRSQLQLIVQTAFPA